MKKTLFFLLISNFILAQWSISNAERGALINIYNATDGENWNRTWDLEKDPRNWFGVAIKNGVVVELNLSGNALSGYFPTYVSSLSRLTKLDLSNNKLTGEVAMGVSALSSLSRLDVSNNRLIGDPTNSLAGLFNLEDLGLGGNQFTISDVNGLLQNFNNIKILNIGDLGLTTVPAKIATFSNLETLVLDNNPIVPNGYGNIAGLTNLKTLSLSGNSLAQIPTQVSQRTQLTNLNLGNNALTEQTLTGLSNLVNLQWLSLENNQLAQVPAQLPQLTKLQTLNLGRNQITGGVSALASLSSLQQLFLNNNQLSGGFPSALLGMSRLMMLNLNSNQLTGELPNRLPAITHISNNRFSKNDLSNYIEDFAEQTDFNYSPQRYDAVKTVLAVAGQPATLDQSLSGDYTFTWFKNLDQKLNNSTENLNFNNVEQTDFAVYTAEAYSYKMLQNNILFDLSLFREPITLGDALATLETSELKDLNIYPNPATDYVNIINLRHNIEKVVIFDLSGKQMLSDSKQRIHVSKLPSGVYLLSVKTNVGIKNFKFIKQ
ncbi:leucine-rich repeat domain-containing protein [Epilithonimonas xixisoli]|uniref:Putative secreted protein (Por secretion system target) n=1 Tax=Epilithonimonas xixisoli TaxID=1476462 RepID=A0A4R8IER4_9FLAO|nr:leucine-rich repeat domain-containing protein [Epilithonimonas xixisoli]TDX84170.1 putative secreted protein (Por secretion system target) [Epilithonimonas xixisoli]